MKLTGTLKKQVDKATDREEKRSLIEKAGMMLNEDELDQVTGGIRVPPPGGNVCRKCGTLITQEILERNNGYCNACWQIVKSASGDR